MKTRGMITVPLLLVLALPLSARASSGEGELRGQVINSAGLPLGGVCVQAYLGDSAGASTTRADAGGNFALQTLPEGTYYVFFADCWRWQYENAWYLDGLERSQATPVQIVSDEITSITMTLHEAMSTLSGHIRDATGQTYPGACVSIYEDRRGEMGAGSASDNGIYSFGGLPSGSYTVFVGGCNDGWFDQWYSGKTSREVADRIVLDGVTASTGNDIIVVPFVRDAELKLSVEEAAVSSDALITGIVTNVGNLALDAGRIQMSICPKTSGRCSIRFEAIAATQPGQEIRIEWPVSIGSEHMIGEATVRASMTIPRDSVTANDNAEADVYFGAPAAGVGVAV